MINIDQNLEVFEEGLKDLPDEQYITVGELKTLVACIKQATSFGTFPEIHDTSLFAIGNGSGEDDKSNAFEVTSDNIVSELHSNFHNGISVTGETSINGKINLENRDEIDTTKTYQIEDLAKYLVEFKNEVVALTNRVKSLEDYNNATAKLVDDEVNSNKENWNSVANELLAISNDKTLLKQLKEFKQEYENVMKNKINAEGAIESVGALQHIEELTAIDSAFSMTAAITRADVAKQELLTHSNNLTATLNEAEATAKNYIDNLESTKSSMVATVKSDITNELTAYTTAVTNMENQMRAATDVAEEFSDLIGKYTNLDIRVTALEAKHN